MPCGDAAGISAKIAELFERQQSGETVSYSVPREKTWQHVTNEYGKVISRIL